MIEIIQGDLLKSDCTVIGHQANCFSTMGYGIAKQIADKYPAAKLADIRFSPMSPKERLGKVSYAVISSEEGTRAVFNLYGQYDYGRDPKRVYTNYAALRSALGNMMYFVKELESRRVVAPTKIGLPYGIGAGLANGQWSMIEKIIREVSDFHNRKVYLYQLDR